MLFAAGGQTIELRERDEAGPAARERPRLLLIAIDGVDRDILYALLRGGSMPELAGADLAESLAVLEGRETQIAGAAVSDVPASIARSGAPSRG